MLTNEAPIRESDPCVATRAGPSLNLETLLRFLEMKPHYHQLLVSVTMRTCYTKTHRMLAVVCQMNAMETAARVVCGLSLESNMQPLVFQ